MFRLLGYLWAAPVTAVGIGLAGLAVGTGGRAHVRAGVVEAHGGVLKRLLRNGAALCLGHVILARDADCLDRSRPHELIHVGQFARWGPLLPPVYWLIGWWLRIRGLDPYLDHPFEPAPRDV